MANGNAPERKDIEREERIATVSDMWLKGKSQRQIAKILGVTQPTVSSDMKILRRRWLEDADNNTKARLEQELKRLDGLESEAWDEYERSKKPSEKKITHRKKLSGGKDKDKVEENATLITEDRTGDVRFLSIIGNCISQRCRILGLEKAPKEQQLAPSEVIGRMAPVLARHFRSLNLSRDSVDQILTDLNGAFDMSPVTMAKRIEDKNIIDAEVIEEKDDNNNGHSNGSNGHQTNGKDH